MHSGAGDGQPARLRSGGTAGAGGGPRRGRGSGAAARELSLEVEPDELEAVIAPEKLVTDDQSRHAEHAAVRAGPTDAR
jgi:hypothetical protein